MQWLILSTVAALCPIFPHQLSILSWWWIACVLPKPCCIVLIKVASRTNSRTVTFFVEPSNVGTLWMIIHWSFQMNIPFAPDSSYTQLHLSIFHNTIRLLGTRYLWHLHELHHIFISLGGYIVRSISLHKVIMASRYEDTVRSFSAKATWTWVCWSREQGGGKLFHEILNNRRVAPWCTPFG